MSDDGAARPPAAVLLELAQGFMMAKALQVAATLGIADLVADGPRSVADLATATKTDERSLGRLLRALAGRGIFRSELDAGGGDALYGNTAGSEPLRTDVPGSVRDYVTFVAHDGNLAAWTELDEVVRTGEPSFERVNGLVLWEYLAAHPDLELGFNRAMTTLSEMAIPQILAGCDFSRFGSVADIGGGEGRLLAAILESNPGMTGTLFDLPTAVDAATRYLASRGLADRTTVVDGDLFTSIPPGHDAYVLKHILHDWSDDRALDILRVCRRATGPGSRLVIVDAVMEPGDAPHPSKWLDLHMMVVLGGRERTPADFATLLDAAGFALVSATPLPGMAGVVEAEPV